MIVAKGLMQVLTQEEVKAVIAHEFYHVTTGDRLWRFFTGWIGGAAAPIAVLVFLRLGHDASIGRLVIVISVALAAALLQGKMLARSERKADEFARLYADPMSLQSAHAKLKKTNLEVWGRGPNEEEGLSDAELATKQLDAIGGESAVLKFWESAKESLSRDEVFDRISFEVQLSTLGKYVYGLVDGKRTVAEICTVAANKRRMPASWVYRLLEQMKSHGLLIS